MCGTVCDDLEITIDDGRVVGCSPPCSLAEGWWLKQNAFDRPCTRIDGRAVSHVAAIQRAAELLGQSKCPLVYGLSSSSTPGQRAAVRLADQIGASIDTTASTCHAPSIVALQSVGESTSSLGEIRNRSDLVIYWGSNPLESHPRHVERYVDAPGMFVANGRDDRHLIVIDTVRSSTAEIADTFIEVESGRDFELICVLRALMKGVKVAEIPVAGIPYEQIALLAQRMMSCQYGAVFFGLGLTKQGVAHATVEALLRLVTDVNAHARFVARRMRIPGDVAGADTVLCWQTGFPFSVNLARGYPRYGPGEYTANNLLERREVDVVLLVGSEGIEKLSTAAQAYLKTIPRIILDHPDVESPIPATVHFTTAVYGLHEPGTAYRMDETPIPLRKLITSQLPTDHGILDQIRSAC